MEAVQAIHELLAEAGLLGKEVSLEGFGIIAPVIAFDLTTGTEMLKTEVVDASKDPLADQPPIVGEFYGFHPAIRLDTGDTNNDDEEGSLLDDTTDDDIDELANARFRVTLHYRIRVHQGVVLGNFVGGMYTLGSITDTHITFTEDKQAQEAAPALNTLADATHSATAALASAKLDTLLTTTDDETVYDKHRLHAIGATLRELERQQGIDMKYRDAVLDLVAARLGAYPDAMFAIKAKTGFLRSNNRVLLATDNLKGTFSILGLEFVPYFTIEDGEAVPTNDESLALIIPSSTNGEDLVQCCIPFENITSLKPVSMSEEE